VGSTATAIRSDARMQAMPAGMVGFTSTALRGKAIFAMMVFILSLLDRSAAGGDVGLTNCSAVMPGINLGCCHSLLVSNASSTDLPASRRPLTRMAYASGKSLPYDAGHYHTCKNTDGAAYFLLGWHIVQKDLPVAELGLCLPAMCSKVDVEALVGAGYGDSGVSTAAVASRTQAAVIKAERVVSGFGASFCARASQGGPRGGAIAAAHCREYRVVMAALDAAMALAAEAGGGGGGDGWIGNGGGTVRLIVTGGDDRIGFVQRATSGWAAFFLAATMALLLTVSVATGLDLMGQGGSGGSCGGGGGAPRRHDGNGELAEPLMQHAEGAVPAPAAAAALVVAPATTPYRGGSTTMTLTAVIADKLKVLSLCRNLPKLLASPGRAGPTDCLNGMRVVSMIWIILGHTMMMPAPINGYDNPEDLLARWGARGSMWFQLVIGGEIAVDSFFYLSGFLMAYLGVKDLERRGGKIPVLRMVAHRYVRITPAFATTLVFYSEIASRVGDGPFFIRFQRSIFRRCDKMWWSELLYLHNFLPFDSDKVCMGWSWYLGNDFIFFLCSPAILLLHHHCPRTMWLAMAGVAAASFVLTVRSSPSSASILAPPPKSYRINTVFSRCAMITKT